MKGEEDLMSKYKEIHLNDLDLTVKLENYLTIKMIIFFLLNVMENLFLSSFIFPPFQPLLKKIILSQLQNSVDIEKSYV